MKGQQRLVNSLGDIGDELILEAARYRRRPMRKALTAAAALLCAAVVTFAALYAVTSVRMQRSDAPLFCIVDGRIYKLRTGPAAVLAVMGFSVKGKTAEAGAFTADTPEELPAAVKKAARSHAEANGAEHNGAVDIDPVLTVYRSNGGATVVFEFSGSREAYSPCGLAACLGVEGAEEELAVKVSCGRWSAEPDADMADLLKNLIFKASSVGWAEELFDTNEIDAESFLSKHGGVQIDLKTGFATHSVFWLADEGLLISDDGACFAPEDPQAIAALIESLRPEPALPNKDR